MKLLAAFCVAIALTGAVLSGQAPAFGAVSIKPSKAKYGNFWPPQNGLWRDPGVTLSQLIAFAYDLHCCDLAVEGGPAWVKKQTFDLEATLPSAAVSTDDQRAMVRQLLADRFHLVTHAATDAVPVDTLDIAPGGAKLRAVASTCHLTFVLDSKDPPQACGITIVGASSGALDKFEFHARSVSMPFLAALFESFFTPQLGERRPVVDRTGLTGRYDFDAAGEFPPAPPEGQSSLDTMSGDFLALEKTLAEQAGLKFELFHTVKLPIPVRIVDSADLPTPN